MVIQYFQSLVVKIKTFVQNNERTIKNHVIGWTVYNAVGILFAYASTDGELNVTAALVTIIYTVPYFYLVLNFAFLPYLPNRKSIAIIKAILVLGIMVMIKVFADKYIFEINTNLYTKPVYSIIIYEIWRFSDTTFYVFAYWIYLQRLKEVRLRLELGIKLKVTEEKLLQEEIKFLKAQINPHFLFNTLNFFYAQIYKFSPKIGEGIMMLTDIMRYNVQSTQSDLIPIEKEAEFLKKYLAIQQLRFQETLQVKLVTEIFSPNLGIPPLIILTFVENAFKYGKLNDPNSPLIIKVYSDPENIEFYCQNLINTYFQEPSTSVGLDNIKIRLEKFYLDYNLDVTNDGKFYTVNLSIRPPVP